MALCWITIQVSFWFLYVFFVYDLMRSDLIWWCLCDLTCVLCLNRFLSIAIVYGRADCFQSFCPFSEARMCEWTYQRANCMRFSTYRRMRKQKEKYGLAARFRTLFMRSVFGANLSFPSLSLTRLFVVPPVFQLMLVHCESISAQLLLMHRECTTSQWMIKTRALCVLRDLSLCAHQQI